MSGMDLGAKPPPAKYRLTTTVKQTGQVSACQLIRQFRIVIVSVVKICK